MSEGTVERDTREVSIKDRLLEEIICLADPTAASRIDVKTFLNRPQFYRTYQDILQQVGHITLDELLMDYRLQAIDAGAAVPYDRFFAEGKHLVRYLGLGRDALEDLMDLRKKTDTNLNMMNYWKERALAVDETMEPQRYLERMREKPGRLQAKIMSRQEKKWALYGAFAWALVRGWPDQAIDCLKFVAQIKDIPSASVINHFEPILSSMHTQVKQLGEGIRGRRPSLDAIGGSSAVSYIKQMDQAMEKQGFIFNKQSDKYISLSPTD